LRLFGGAIFALSLASCSTNETAVQRIPTNLPNIALYDSPQTPPHSLQHTNYPFAPNGNYVTAWAAEGGVIPDTGSSSGSHHGDGGASSSRNSKVTTLSSNKSKSKSTASTKKSTVSSKVKSKAKLSKYTVKSSDSLYSIAKKHGTTVAKIKAANGLKSDSIRDGRSLTIP
jgi:LysM repeat protein